MCVKYMSRPCATTMQNLMVLKQEVDKKRSSGWSYRKMEPRRCSVLFIFGDVKALVTSAKLHIPC